MYCEFFGLQAPPFNNTPDPQFFFNTPDHEEALASLIYAAQERKGFVLVTGEVGAGKTLLSRMLLTRLPVGTKTAVITNTRLGGADLLRAICREYQLDVPEGATAADLSTALEKYLLDQYARARLAVLILDEAQNLPPDVFEEIRMLGNLEADNAKLLQVLILGQPELQTMFRQPHMRQLYQRVFRTFHLKELTPELTARYIEHRLQVAGLARGRFLFTPEAVRRIHEYAEGIPRLINQVCDNSLLAAYTDSICPVTDEIVREVAEQMMALTVDPQDIKPRGAFARRMTVEADERGAPADARRSTAAAADSSDGSAEEAQRLRERLERIEAAIRTVTERIGQSERKLGGVELQTKALLSDDTQALIDLEALAGQLDAVETMRHRAAEVLKEARLAGERGREELVALFAEAREEVERMKLRAAGLAEETRSEAAGLLSQARSLWEEVSRQADQRKRDTELLVAPKQAGAEFLMRHIDEEEAAIRANRDRDAGLADQARQAISGRMQAVQEQIESAGDRCQKRADRLVRSLEEFVRETRARVEGSHRGLAETMEQAQSELDAARAALAEGRRRIAEDTQSSRQRAEEQLRQVQELLDRMREQYAGLLAEMSLRDAKRAHDGGVLSEEAAAQSAQAAFTLQAQIAETRMQADQAREELERVVARAVSVVGETRESFGSEIRDRQQEIMRLRSQAEALRQELSRDVEEARDRLQEAFDDQRERSRALQRRAGEVVQEAETALQRARAASRVDLETVKNEISASLTGASGRFEEMRTRVERDLASLTHRAEAILASATQATEQMQATLATVTAAMQSQAEELRESLRREGDQVRDETAAAASASRAGFEDVHRRIDGLSRLAEESMKEFEQRVNSVQARLQGALAQGDNRVQELLATLSGESNRFSRLFAEGLSTLRDRLQEETAARVTAIQAEVGEAARRCGQLTTELRAAQEGIRADLEASRSALDAHQAEARVAADRLAAELTRAIGRTTRSGEELEARVTGVLRQADERLANVSGRAEALTVGLGRTFELLERKVADCHAQFDAQTGKVERLLTEITDRNRAAVDDCQQRVEALARNAAAAADGLAARLTELRDSAQSEVGALSARLRDQLIETTAACERIRGDAEAASAEFSRRTSDVVRESETWVGRAEESIAALREQGRSSLAEVRGALAQMVDRSASLQRDLARSGEEIAASSRLSLQQVHEATAGAVGQIEAMREGAARDGEAQARRLTALRASVEQGAEQVRANAAQMLEQVQAGSAVIRQHADELLRRAESGSQKVADQATRLMEQAAASSDRFREQAEALLRRTESTAEALRAEAQSVRAELVEEAQDMRRQVDAASKDASSARQMSAEAVRTIEDGQRSAEARTAEMLRRAEEVQDRTRALLDMPRELVQEAQQTATALSGMSKKVSAIVAQLAKAQAAAAGRQEEIDRANSTADEKIEQLARHTARVAKLVEVIRQLYSAMDSRVEKLRERLTRAEALCESVPQEIDHLRTALRGDGDRPLVTPRRTNGRGETATAGSGSRGGKGATPRNAAPASANGGVTTDERLRRSQRLNDWLREALADAGKKLPATTGVDARAGAVESAGAA